MAFRTSPQLGPQIDETFVTVPYYDEGLAVGRGNAVAVEPSYRLGNIEAGSDGATYIFVKNGAADLAKDAKVAIDDKFVATAGEGNYAAPLAVKAGAYFHARRA